MTEWSAIPEKSFVGFSIKHLMFSKVKGQFKTFSSNLFLNEVQFETSSVKAQIHTSTIFTNDRERDLYLVSDSFFNPIVYPFISFESKKIMGEFDHFTLTGDLKVKDISQSVQLEGKLNWENSERSLLKAKATATINRKKFGLSWNSLIETGGILVGENIDLEINVLFHPVK